MSASPRDFRPVTRREPCLICGKPDWCRRSADGAHECHRIHEPNVNGFIQLTVTPGGSSVYRRAEDRAPHPPKPPLPSRAKLRVFKTPEAAAGDFASFRGGTVETLYKWTEDWYRARIKLPDGKAFCEITRDGTGWVLRGPSKPHALYRVDELPTDEIVAVAEGEKACDVAWLIGLPCVTSGAANSANSACWSPLRGRWTVILPDNDDVGEQYAKDVARELLALDPSAEVRIVHLPGLKKGEDLFDFVNVHRDSRDAEDIRAEIFALVAATPPYEPEEAGEQEASTWPEPQPLPNELPDVNPFTFDLLPDAFRGWIEDIAERLQCPPDFPAIACVIALATVVGRKLGIRPKRHDDWTVVANLWGAAIGPPSVMKSPAIQEALKPLKRLEIEAKREFDEAMTEHEVRQLVDEMKKQHAKRAIKDALDKGTGEQLTIAREAVSSEKPPPVRKRYLVNDSTVEKLGELLNENRYGVLVFRDELIGFLKSLDKEGQEGARAFYLEAWNGDGRHTYDRIGRGTIDIEAAIVSMLGSIQPGPLCSYLRGAIAGDEGADGLIQRFQLAVYPTISKVWLNVDRWPDSQAKNRAYDVIDALDRLDGSAVGARTDDGSPDGIPYLRFDGAAQERFDQWREGLERRMRCDDEHPVIAAHLAKYRSLFPSLALLFHLADVRHGPVGIESLDRAIKWDAYLESHARRIYAVAAAPDAMEGALLAKKIQAGDVSNEFSLRDVYRKQWVGLNTREAAERAVAFLLDLDWLVRIDEATAGRPRTRYRINPQVERKRSG